MAYKEYVVDYWNHAPSINDCYGNRQTWTGKAVSDSEAIQKAIQANCNLPFRLRNAYEKPYEQPTLYSELKARNIPIENHESDLFFPYSAETKDLLTKFGEGRYSTTFKHQIHGTIWFDVPFAYLPFWEEKYKNRIRTSELKELLIAAHGQGNVYAITDAINRIVDLRSFAISQLICDFLTNSKIGSTELEYARQQCLMLDTFWYKPRTRLESIAIGKCFRLDGQTSTLFMRITSPNCIPQTDDIWVVNLSNGGVTKLAKESAVVEVNDLPKPN